MGNSLIRTAILSLLLITISACVNHNNSSITHLSISGEIDLPIMTPQKKYWLDAGPLFVVSKNPLISYRVIRKNEIEFSGSEKSVFDFFQSVYTSPIGDSEDSLAESYKNHQKSYELNRGLNFYTYKNSYEAKVYVTSKKLDIGIEIFINSENNSIILKKIIENINLTQGEK